MALKGHNTVSQPRDMGRLPNTVSVTQKAVCPNLAIVLGTPYNQSTVLPFT